MDSLISADNVFGIWAALFTIVALAFWIESRPGKLSSFGPISLIVFGLVASNIGILPKSAPSYDVVTSYFVPAAIPLLLFGADLVAIWREAKRLLIVFMFGAVGTVLGALLALVLVPLGPDTPSYAGMFAATYIGGSVNFAAVAHALEVDKTPMMAPALAANSIAATLFLIWLVAIPSIGFMVGRFKSGDHAKATANGSKPKLDDGPLTPISISVSLALTAVINLAGYFFANLFGVGFATLLFVTAITVFIATAWPRIAQYTSGHFKLGSLLIYVFFVLIGVTSDLRTLFEGGAMFVLFAAIILTAHFFVIFGCAKLFRFTLAEAVTASNACALGPAPAAAVAVARGWTDLATPAVLMGVFGYFISNFIGLAIAKIF